MDATIRATCPQCQSSLKIPATWAGQAVKCKKCGSVVRTKAPAAPAAGPTLAATPLDSTVPAVTPAAYGSPDPFADLGPAARAAKSNPFEAGAAHPANGEPAPYFPPVVPAPAVAPGYYPPPAAGYAAPPAQDYPYPVPASPAYAQTVPAAAVTDFTPSAATSAYRGRGQYRRGSGNAKYVWIGVGLVLTAGLVLGGVYGTRYVKQLIAQNNGEGPGEPKNQAGTTPGGNKPLLANSGPFPRRMLFIHVSNYLYLNPLTYAAQQGTSRGPDRTRSAAMRLGYEWRVPVDKDNNQSYVISDTAPAPETRAPMKGVIQGSYEKFFSTSRPQDRVVVYFGGHVLTAEGKTYLIPIEGDPDEPSTLIPLDDFYAKMKASPATQKVVIWDVCRFNPGRGRTRPGSEPMSEETAAALAAVPAGVQAVITCQPGENALEFFDLTPDGPTKPAVAGSNFLEATRYVAEKNRTGAAVAPNDPIKVDEWAAAINKRVNEVAAYSDPKLKQTVKVVGTPPASLVPFNKDEAFATRFDYPPAPKGASAAEITELVSEFSLPGIKSDDGESGVANFPFPAEALAAYKADVPIAEVADNKQKYPFRAAVIDSFEAIRKVWGKDGRTLRETFTDKTSDAIKKQILEEQLFPAEAIPRLEAAITRLEAVEEMKAGQPKRWQAHYDYALAQCKARLAFMNEYNLALGSIRTEVLPPLKPGDDGYKLISAEKMKVKKEAKYAEEAKELFESIVTDYKGSPWAIQAKRDKGLSLGLAWQSFNSKAMEAKDSN